MTLPLLKPLNIWMDTRMTPMHLRISIPEKQRYQQAVQAYTQRFGPLQAKDGAYTNTWSWMSYLWPWEGVDQ